MKKLLAVVTFCASMLLAASSFAFVHSFNLGSNVKVWNGKTKMTLTDQHTRFLARHGRAKLWIHRKINKVSIRCYAGTACKNSADLNEIEIIDEDGNRFLLHSRRAVQFLLKKFPNLLADSNQAFTSNVDFAIRMHDLANIGLNEFWAYGYGDHIKKIALPEEFANLIGMQK